MTDRCTAKARSTGEQCKNPPIKGATVCRMHGGSAPQVKKKAQERLDEMADSTTANIQQDIEELHNAFESAETPDDKVALIREIRQCWKIILDRTGHGPTEKREVTGAEGGPLEITLNETVVETGYESE